MQGIIKDKEQMEHFLSGGNAIFTLHNNRTGNRYTYKVTQKKGGDIFWVKLLNGTDNTQDYRFFGTMFPNCNPRGYWLKHSFKGQIGETARSVVTFKWFIQRLQEDTPFPEPFEFYHEGRCGRCGRKLTVPESITSGFGPKCSQL